MGVGGDRPASVLVGGGGLRRGGTGAFRGQSHSQAGPVPGRLRARAEQTLLGVSVQRLSEVFGSHSCGLCAAVFSE